LKAKSKTDLNEFAQVLKRYPDTDLVIEGHTDNTGKKARNEKLSVSRAEAVISFLGAEGVAPTRMKGRGYADERPVADNKTEDGRKQNRRVEVQIEANQQLKQQSAGAT
jgi:outer membrane protein OmpA-like peptidoglycan-associated protein